jgi:hypothetical protein
LQEIPDGYYIVADNTYTLRATLIVVLDFL